MSVIKKDQLTITSNKPIGCGYSACIYLARLDSRLVVIKEFKNGSNEFDNELAILKSLNHENVVKLIGYFTSPPKEKCLVLEYISGGDLSTYIDNNKPNNWTILSGLHYQIIEGMEYLHGRNIVHYDLKYENILYNNGRIKITDFGISRKVVKSFGRAKFVRGTKYYMAPEVANGWCAVYESDVWSFGCMLYYVATGRPPYHDMDAETLFRRLQLDRELPLAPLRNHNIPPLFAQATEACLRWNLVHRPSFSMLKTFLRTGVWSGSHGKTTKVPPSISVLRTSINKVKKKVKRLRKK